MPSKQKGSTIKHPYLHSYEIWNEGKEIDDHHGSITRCSRSSWRPEKWYSYFSTSHFDWLDSYMGRGAFSSDICSSCEIATGTYWNIFKPLTVNVYGSRSNISITMWEREGIPKINSNPIKSGAFKGVSPHWPTAQKHEPRAISCRNDTTKTENRIGQMNTKCRSLCLVDRERRPLTCPLTGGEWKVDGSIDRVFNLRVRQSKAETPRSFVVSVIGIEVMIMAFLWGLISMERLLDQFQNCFVIWRRNVRLRTIGQRRRKLLIFLSVQSKFWRRKI